MTCSILTKRDDDGNITISAPDGTSITMTPHEAALLALRLNTLTGQFMERVQPSSWCTSPHEVPPEALHNKLEEQAARFKCTIVKQLDPTTWVVESRDEHRLHGSVRVTLSDPNTVAFFATPNYTWAKYLEWCLRETLAEHFKAICYTEEGSRNPNPNRYTSFEQFLDKGLSPDPMLTAAYAASNSLE